MKAMVATTTTVTANTMTMIYDISKGTGAHKTLLEFAGNVLHKIRERKLWLCLLFVLKATRFYQMKTSKQLFWDFFVSCTFLITTLISYQCFDTSLHQGMWRWLHIISWSDVGGSNVKKGLFKWWNLVHSSAFWPWFLSLLKAQMYAWKVK